jgi:hypothetical protein
MSKYYLPDLFNLKENFPSTRMIPPPVERKMTTRIQLLSMQKAIQIVAKGPPVKYVQKPFLIW